MQLSCSLLVNSLGNKTVVEGYAIALAKCLCHKHFTHKAIDKRRVNAMPLSMLNTSNSIAKQKQPATEVTTTDFHILIIF